MRHMKSTKHRDQLRQSSNAELERMLKEERKNLFMSRRDSATKQLEDSRKIRQTRKNIARILTILREREIASAEAGR